MKVKEKKVGSLILNPKDILIQYSKQIISMANSNNDVYTLLVIGYIKKHISLLGEVLTTLDNIVEECGYHTKSNSKENNKYFKDAIQKLQSEKYLIILQDIDTLKNNELIKISLNPEKDLFFCDNKFVAITVEDFIKITSYVGKVKIGMLLNTYLAIKQYIFNNNSISYPSKSHIAKIIGVSSLTTVENLLNALIDIGLIYTTGNYYIKNKDGSNTYVQARRLYALNKSALDNAKIILKSIYHDVEVYDEVEINKMNILRLNGRK